MMGFNYTGGRAIERRASWQERRWLRIGLLILAVWLVSQSCGTIVINREIRRTIYSPIVDGYDRVHDYKRNKVMQAGEDYDLFCVRHYKWERIKVRYEQSDDTGIYKVGYSVKSHRK